MNRIIISGGLTAKPELKYTSNGIAVSKFTVAVSRIKKEEGADFINCVAWKQTAELITKYLDKGSRVLIDGKLQTSTYEKKDGSKGHITEVLVQNVEFIGNKKKEESTEEVSKGETEQVDIYKEFGELVSLDDNFLD